KIIGSKIVKSLVSRAWSWRHSLPQNFESTDVMTDSNQRREHVLRAAFDCREELIAYAWSLIGNYSAAEDCVQEAMLVVVNKYEQFQDGTSILAWCRSIVRIETLRAKQRYRRERTLAEQVLDDAIDAAFEEFQVSRIREEGNIRRDALGHCIEQLNERGKQVLRARVVDELGYSQIGERLGMTIEAVRKALFRSKRQLRTCVESKVSTAQ
ncbi:MAG: sigma-70 family RNA polymerase sigma factor, partial [Pirellulaceae bacterium]